MEVSPSKQNLDHRTILHVGMQDRLPIFVQAILPQTINPQHCARWRVQDCWTKSTRAIYARDLVSMITMVILGGMDDLAHQRTPQRTTKGMLSIQMRMF